MDAFAELFIKNTLDDLKQLESDLELRCVSHSTKRNSLHGLPRGQVRLFLMAKGQQQFLAKPYLDNGIYHQRVFLIMLATFLIIADTVTKEKAPNCFEGIPIWISTSGADV